MPVLHGLSRETSAIRADPPSSEWVRSRYHNEGTICATFHTRLLPDLGHLIHAMPPTIQPLHAREPAAVRHRLDWRMWHGIKLVIRQLPIILHSNLANVIGNVSIFDSCKLRAERTYAALLPVESQ